MHRFLACTTMSLLALPVFAADRDHDGLDDDAVITPHSSPVQGSAVGILDMSSAGQYTLLLDQLGYSYALIPIDSDYEDLAQYELVLLPASHAGGCCRDILAQRAASYHQYVAEGGCLYVGQPNPFEQPPNIPWVPYLLELDAAYLVDCVGYITNPDHCMTQGGLVQSDLPWAADTVLDMGPEWEVLVRQVASERPSLFTAPFGKGQVVVDLDNPDGSSICGLRTIAGFARILECCLQHPVSVEPFTWGRIKDQYRD